MEKIISGAMLVGLALAIFGGLALESKFISILGIALFVIAGEIGVYSRGSG